MNTKVNSRRPPAYNRALPTDKDGASMRDTDDTLRIAFRLKEDLDPILKDWKEANSPVCKPCWELKYCPYGPLVEQFPFPPIGRKQALEHQALLKRVLKKGVRDPKRRTRIKEMIANFNPEEHPLKPDRSHDEKACTVFGHFCPVFFVSGGFTETREGRRLGRKIPRSVMLRVVRRDNNQCQTCGRVLRDDEIEFDHVIPVSKGGSSEEHNVRVACFDCNRSKSDRYVP